MKCNAAARSRRITHVSETDSQLEHAPDRRSGALPRWRKALFAIAVPVLLFGGLELGIRLAVWTQLIREPAIRSLREAWESDGWRADRILGWGLLKNGQIPKYWVEHTNSLGLRDEEIPLAKGAGEFRVLNIGDSTTFGYGVEAAATYSDRLEESLRRRTRRSVQVINAGVPGFSSCQCLLYLRHFGLDLAPDVVIVLTNYNDRRAVPPHGQPDSPAYFRSLYRQLRLREVMNHSMLYRMLEHRANDSFSLGYYADKEIPLDSAAPRVSPSAFKANLQEAIRISREAGAAVILIGLPDDPLALRNVQLGQQLVDEGRWLEAASALQLAMEEDKFPIVAQKLLNRVWAEIGQPDRIADAVRVRQGGITHDGHKPIFFSKPYLAIIRALGAEMNVPLIVPRQKRLGDSGIYLDEIHLNEKGHAILARQLHDLIVGMPSFQSALE